MKQNKMHGKIKIQFKIKKKNPGLKPIWAWSQGLCFLKSTFQGHDTSRLTMHKICICCIGFIPRYADWQIISKCSYFSYHLPFWSQEFTRSDTLQHDTAAIPVSSCTTDMYLSTKMKRLLLFEIGVFRENRT